MTVKIIFYSNLWYVKREYLAFNESTCAIPNTYVIDFTSLHCNVLFVAPQVVFIVTSRAVGECTR